MFSNLKLSTKLIIAFLLVGIVPFAVISMSAIKNGEKALTEKTLAQNVALRDIKIQQIQDAINTKRKQAQTLSKMATIIDAMKEFKEAFPKFREENSAKSTSDLKEKLYTYYENEFQNEYKSHNNGASAPGLKNKFSMLDQDSMVLQYHYIRANRFPLGSKDRLDHPGDFSTYSKLHAKYHPGIRYFLKTFGYYDIFLVDLDTGDIVYSVFKELDFSTSLLSGPFANTNFGEVFRAAKKADDPNFVKVVDLKPYLPSYDYPAGFVASPIFDGDVKVGVLILQIPVEQIDSILTNNGKWKETGMGESGETYLVGNDGYMRSNSRFLVESPNEYFDFVKSLGMSEKTLNNIKAKKTTVLNQKIETLGTEMALGGTKGASIFPDYRGVRVVSAYAPVELEDLNWVLMAETDETEAFQSVFFLKKSVGFGLVIGVILISIVAVIISRPLLNALTHAMGSLHKSTEQLYAASDQLTGSSQSLAESFTEQASNIEETSSAMEEMAAMAGENAEHAISANNMVHETRSTVDSGSIHVKNMVESMAVIKSAFDKINKIVRSIEEIAFQTKLLSLNAALEAAGAGEAGKRFSVVADEVRNLSHRAAEAAKEAVLLISNANERVRSGNEIADSLKESFEDVEKSTVKVTSLVAEIHAASTEQAQGCDQVNRAMVQLDQATQGNASTSQEASASAQQLAEQANQMREIVATLSSLVGGKSTAAATLSSTQKYGNGVASSVQPHTSTSTSTDKQHQNSPNAEQEGSENGEAVAAEESFKQF